jgi:DNA-binding MarR family transcriptional regulator
MRRVAYDGKVHRRVIACPDPAVIAETEEILTHLRVLRRDVLRNPFLEAKRSGLTGPQVTVMAQLFSHGPLTLTALSRQLGMSHSTASGIVDRLEGRGLVLRTPDPSDRRRTQITVTGVVTEYVQELAEGPSGRLATALASATAEQRRAIIDGLRLLRRLLE